MYGRYLRYNLPPPPALYLKYDLDLQAMLIRLHDMTQDWRAASLRVHVRKEVLID